MGIDRAEALRQRLARQRGVPLPTAAVPANLADAFARSVERHGDRTAVRCAGVALSYRDLDNRVAELAGTLRDRGAGADTLVGVLLDRSIDMVVAALAVIRVGAAYVPIDPATPPARVELIRTDAAPALVITSRPLSGRLGAGVATLLVDEPHPAAVPLRDCPADRDSRAYVIFTSGTTGRPKGVQVSHGNVLWLFRDSAAVYGFSRDDVWTLFHSFAFDFSVWEMWGALLYGGCVVVVPSETAKDPAAFRALLRDEGVTVLNQTPTAFTQLMGEDTRHADRLPLRHVIFGGEALRFPDLAPWFAKYGDTAPRLVNMYGITETTVVSTYRPVTRADLSRSDSAIGVPMSELDFLLVDEDLNPVPDGEIGEIVVTGPGVAIGYLNRPELTAQRFVTIRGARGYRSGDLAARTPAGELIYHGRRDDQVKIRGYRIELGEVESAVAAVPGLARAAVVVRDLPGRGPGLVAYAVPEPGAPTAEAIRERLAEVLPGYMLPARIEFLDTMPVTGNGKLDRAALPTPAAEAGSGPAAVTDPVTAGVRDIVAGLLGVPTVATGTDFFALGGHSLLATRLLAGVRERFGVDVSLRDFLLKPTVRALAAAVRSATAATTASSALLPLHHTDEPGPVVVSIPGALGFGLSFAQLSATMPDRAWYSIDLGDLAAARGTGLTLPALVADLAALVVAAAAGRPVHLVGHSLGGTLGFALVPVLRALGQDVASLVLCDAADPLLLTEELRASRGHRMWEYLTHVAMVFPAATTRWPGALPTDGSVPDDDVVGLAETLLDGEVADLFTRGLVAAFHGYQRLADLRWAAPEPVSCPALLVQASTASLGSRQIAGWAALLPDSLTTTRIDAGHIGMIQAPHATALAEMITEFHAEVERPSHRKAS
ncbi:amino acid adenylation domain-containing protein [Actinophytocola glycyrrhizae]|uniref:Amino acid adenylation domain-containing protein n=1 Tax=Actinophytocola glycyrrhizae TaxID=2044873 RepID=A0ABV9S3F9_9PSEU